MKEKVLRKYERKLRRKRRKGEYVGTWGMRGGHTAGLSFRLMALVSPCRRIIWHRVIIALYLFRHWHKHTHASIPACHISCRVSFLTQSPCRLSKHTHAHGLVTPQCITLERTSLNTHNRFLLPPPVPASGLAFISVYKPPDHMGSGGLSWPSATPPTPTPHGGPAVWGEFRGILSSFQLLQTLHNEKSLRACCHFLIAFSLPLLPPTFLI